MGILINCIFMILSTHCGIDLFCIALPISSMHYSLIITFGTIFILFPNRSLKHGHFFFRSIRAQVRMLLNSFIHEELEVAIYLISGGFHSPEECTIQ